MRTKKDDDEREEEAFECVRPHPQKRGMMGIYRYTEGVRVECVCVQLDLHLSL